MKNDTKIIMDINTMEDIKILKNTPSIKYLNLNISSPNIEVIYYLLEHGEKYSYAEKIEDKRGYIYVPYEMFKKSILFILDVINNIPSNLTKIEVARYFYITIGKNIGYDINILPEKNETFNLETNNTLNNIWGSIYNTRGTNYSFAKIYLYLCKLMNIDCKLIYDENLKYYKNLLNINTRNIEVDITKDIPYIQAGFQTRNFTGYDNNLEMDKKIFYIKDNYCEVKLDEIIKQIDYNNPDVFNTILLITGKIIDISKLKPIELGVIYSLIFSKYFPNLKIDINNLYILNDEKKKEHFILISYENKSYSYNYTKNNFIEVSTDEIIKNIEEQKIGIYLNEKIPFLQNKERTI